MQPADTSVILEPIADAYISEGSPATNFGSSTSLFVDRDDFLQERFALLQFDLSSIPFGATVISATLELSLASWSGGDATVTMNLSPALASWSETEVTWDTRPALDCCWGDASIGSTIDAYYTFDVHTLVDAWINDIGFSNFGVAVRGPTDFQIRSFHSREASEHKPRLLITYADPTPDGTIVVQVDEARALKSGDDTVTGNQQDFYVKVAAAGGPFMQSSVADGRDHASWAPPFIVETEVVSAARFFPIQVELWDEDDTSADDPFDIDPDIAKRRADLTFDGCTLRWTLNGTGQEFGPGPRWLPPAELLSSLSSDAGQVRLDVRTSDGRPMSPDDVAIAEATPVQAVYHPQSIIAGKATAFMVRFSSSWAITRTVEVRVDMTDGVNMVTEEKTVDVPPAGLKIFFFDGSGTEGPFFPERTGIHPALEYNVVAVVDGEPPPDTPDPWSGCHSHNNVIDGHELPVIRTRAPEVVYRAWDWERADLDPPAPPEFATVAATANANQILFKAIFPIASNPFIVDAGPYITEYGRSLGLLPPLPGIFGLEPASTILLENVGAMVAGIDRLVLMPRQGWYQDNWDAGLMTFGTRNTIGLSLAEYAPHAVIAEANFSQTTVHELGHTYKLSQHNCSTGGLAEDLLNVGCRDENMHTAADGRPYQGSGYDVEGLVYPTGSGPATPGTREVISTTNIMDTAGGALGTFTRWIDNFSYDYLSQQMKVVGDPPLIAITGYVYAADGLDAPVPEFAGALISSYQFTGLPDFEEAAPGESVGTGDFELRIVRPGDDRSYRFTPLFELEGDDTDIGFFSFSIPWDALTTRLELYGPADITDPQAAQVLLVSEERTPHEPLVSVLRAAADTAPPLAGPQPEPPTVGPGHSVVIAWQASDADSDQLRTILLLHPPPSNTHYNGWLPYAIELEHNQFVIPHELLAARPGLYSGRVIVTDGINSTTFTESFLFTVSLSPDDLYLPVIQH